jgi:hypothetical protein
MKPRLTFEQHVEMGETLAAMSGDLVDREVLVGNAFAKGGRSGLPARKLHAARAAIDQARAELENMMLDDFPEADTSVYYPPRD